MEGLRVTAGRAEPRGGSVAGGFDAVVARCVTDVGRMLELGAGMVRQGGVVVVAGPPGPGIQLPLGEWVSVVGVRPGETRHFARLWRS